MVEEATDGNGTTVPEEVFVDPNTAENDDGELHGNHNTLPGGERVDADKPSKAREGIVSESVSEAVSEGSRPPSRARIVTGSDAVFSETSEGSRPPSRKTMRSSRGTRCGSLEFRNTGLRRKRVFQTRMNGQDAMTADIVFELLDTTGIVIDFIHRSVCPSKNDTPFTGLQKVLNNLAFNNLAAYRHAVTLICRESMRYQLMDAIIFESKEKGMFKACDLRTWYHWGTFIRRQNRDVKCLNVEVHNELVLRRLRRIREVPDSEPITEKRGRLTEFWSAFHDRSRLINKEPNDEHPKNDSESRVKYGMVWDFNKGPQWRIVNPAPGTLKYGELSQFDQAYGGTDRSINRRGSIGFRSVSQPHLLKPPPTPSCSSSISSVSEKLPPLHVRHRYLQDCDKNGKVPIPTNFMTGHSDSLTMDGKNLVDKELLSMARMVSEMKTIREVDLGNNALLTDSGLEKFLHKLLKESIAHSMQKLDLANCSLAGKGAVNEVIAILNAHGALRNLNLSRIWISQADQLRLAEAIGNHPHIVELNLSEIGIVPGPLSKKSIKTMLCSNRLQIIDLSWNNFDGELFKTLGESVVNSSSLKKISVANCASRTNLGPIGDFIPPLSLFIEQMSQNRNLTSLDISMNLCDFRTALILEDSLDTHKKLSELILSENPLGVVGLRSILRLLSRTHTALLHVDLNSCCLESPQNISGLNAPVFSYTNPGGKYVLQMWRPYHRSLLRMLYKMADKLGMAQSEAFDKVVYRDGLSTKHYEHPSKDSFGVYQVPEVGEISLVFCVERAILKKFLSGGKDLLDDHDNLGFFKKYYGEARFKPGFKKIIPLFATWAELAGDQIAQSVFINALSKDFSLTLPMLAHMCESVMESANECLYKLAPAVPEDMASKFVTTKFFKRLEDLTYTFQKAEKFQSFNVTNPTGHYKLELMNPSDYAVGERLLLLDRWEAAVDKKLGRTDVSQYGNGSHIRNPLFNGRSLAVECYSLAEWKLPEDGTLEVDYASNQRPPKGSKVLSDLLFDEILMNMFYSCCDYDDRIAAMRSISDSFYVAARHMRSMIGYFKEERHRANIFITFYLRNVDLQNAKMFRVRFENDEEVRTLQDRLGYASFFPFFQPENCRFNLDLSCHDQRICASMWVALCQKEKYPQNIRDYAYRLPNGNEENTLPLGVPRGWGNPDSIPKEGVFRAEYRCAPEDRNVKARAEFAIQYNFLQGLEDMTDDDVDWWTGLMEPPEDVRNLLEWLISRYEDIEKPFLDIDGVDGNGVITLKEFVSGLEELDCHKFDKKKSDPPETKSKAQRIEAIFRYLDPGQEGSVSREEWNVLGQLWKEFDLSIKEFVHFLTLTFGTDLMVAWQGLDIDGSGEFDEEEFLQAVEKIGYFGPAKVVFALLDSSDDGNISVEEFAVLENYKPH